MVWILKSSPPSMTLVTCQRCKDGLDTISATGNVLRDYLTDLFPILELGTSAKMLSIVPLLAGGGLFETGAGGSAPKHVQQFVEEGHLRWDSLGRISRYRSIFWRISPIKQVTAKHRCWPMHSMPPSVYFWMRTNLHRAKSMNWTTGAATSTSPSFGRKLFAQSADADLQAEFSPIAKSLRENEEKIVNELNDAQDRKSILGDTIYWTKKKQLRRCAQARL